MAQKTSVKNPMHYIIKRVYNMQVAVCDDEQLFIDDIKYAVYEYSNSHRLEISIDEFVSGEELLESKKDYDMVLLDYKMGGIDGLETARILRQRNLNCAILFITSYPEFVYESFEVTPFRFLRKPLDVSVLYIALDDYFTQFGNNYPLVLKFNYERVIVQTNDIVYLEADNKKCYINLVKQRLHCASTMARVEKLLPSSVFIKVHKAYVVNLNYIHKYNNSEILLKNKETAHIGRKYSASFRDVYRKFVKSRIV